VQNAATVINGQGTWGSAQLALVLCGLFAILLVLAPPLLARSLDRRRKPAFAAAPASSIPTQPHGPGPAGQA
jgi:hypothetical protein